MALYIVIVGKEYIRGVENVVPEGDRCEIVPGAWFVHSTRSSAADVAKHIGISKELQGVVVTAKFYSGYGDNSLVEKLGSLAER